MEWARILAYITGTVDQQLLLRNEYLVAENRILKAQLQGRLRLSDAERARLGEIGHRLGRKVLSEVATAALPETILVWYRRLVARKFDGSRAHRCPGRPRIDKEVAELIVGMAKENRSWGYDRIVGALANLGYRVSDQTVGNVLRRHGIARRRSASGRQPGQNSFELTARCWRARTSSRWRSSRCEDW
jgi:putative transposase